MDKMSKQPAGAPLVVLLWYVWLQITHCLPVMCRTLPSFPCMAYSSGRGMKEGNKGMGCLYEAMLIYIHTISLVELITEKI